LAACLMLVAELPAHYPADPTESAKPSTNAKAVPEALNFANGLLRDRRYDLAAEEYERFLQSATSGPDVIEARYGLATSRLFLGQYAEARVQYETFLRDAAANDANAPTARFRIGETAYMMGDLAAARRALETYVRDNP